MFWQREYVRENIAMTLNGTYKLDLPEHGQLGSLLLRMTGTEVSGYGQGGGAWRIVDKISKITILLNGATICKSLTGLEAQALAAQDQGVFPPGHWQNYAANMQSEYFLVNFGLHLFDTGKGLDLANFNNVELQIENTATSATFADLTVSVLGYFLRDAPADSFSGYMRTEEWRSWTTVADETKYNDLPVEHILRRILLQAIPVVDSDYLETTNMANLMDDIDLGLDTGQVRIWKGGIDDLMRENFYDTGKLFLAVGNSYMTADKGINVSLGYVLGGAWGQGSADGAVGATIACMETGRTSFTQKPETYEADHPIGWIFAGIAPFLTALFRFDFNPDPATWLNPELRKTVKLDIHTRNSSSAASGRNAIILDRFVPSGAAPAP